MLKRLVILMLIPFSVFAWPMLTDLDGHHYDAQALKGKWLLINVWASWCHPCLDEIKELNQFYKNHQQTTALFAINYDDMPLDESKAMAKSAHLNYPTLNKASVDALRLGMVQAVPATFVFNPNGELATIAYGGQTQKSLLSLMKDDLNFH